MPVVFVNPNSSASVLGSKFSFSPEPHSTKRFPLDEVSLDRLTNHGVDVQKGFELFKSNFESNKSHMSSSCQEKCQEIICKIEAILCTGGFALNAKEYHQLSLCFDELMQKFGLNKGEEIEGLISKSRQLSTEAAARYVILGQNSGSNAAGNLDQFNRPGTSYERAAELSMGLGYGAEVAGIAGKVEVGGKGGFANFIESGDDSSVSEAKYRSFGFFSKLAAVFASAEAEASFKVIYSDEYNSVKHYVDFLGPNGLQKKGLLGSRGLSTKKNEPDFAGKIQESVNQRSSFSEVWGNNPALLKCADPLLVRYSPDLKLSEGQGYTLESKVKIKRYNDAPLSRRIPPMVEIEGGGEKKSTPVPAPLKATTRVFKGGATLGANMTGLSSSFSGNVESAITTLKVPVTPQKVVESAVIDLEHARLQYVLELAETAGHRVLSQPKKAILEKWFWNQTAANESELDALTEELQSHFNNFCWKVQDTDYRISIAPRSDGESIEAALLKEFDGRSREYVLVDLCMVHALLLHKAMEYFPQGKVLAELKDLGDQLYSPPISFDKALFDQKISFIDLVKTAKTSKVAEFNVTGGIPGFGFKCKATYAEFSRINPKLYSAGDYRDLTLTLTGALGTDALKIIAGELVTKIDLPGADADIISSELGNIALQPGIELEGGIKVMFRFFQPAYQNVEGFPQDAKGYRLQLTRVGKDRIVKVSGAVPIPTPVAGLTVNLGAKLSGTVKEVISERWGENSLSAPMMHYMNLKVINQSSRWEKQSQDCLYEKPMVGGDSFLKLARNLTDKQSAVHLEAEYFLNCQQVGLDKEDTFAKDFFITMHTFIADDNQTNRKLAQDSLEKLIERQFPQWENEKLRYAGRERAVKIL